MSHNLNLAELAKQLAVNIPDQFLQELEHDLDEELRSIRLYEDTLSTLEELKAVTGMNTKSAQAVYEFFHVT